MTNDMPGYGGGAYCRNCYSMTHGTGNCPHDQGGDHDDDA